MPKRADILRTFEMYNAVLFGSRIQVPDVMVRRMGDCARWYAPELDMHDSDKPGRTRGLLVISTSALHKMTWRGTLLHELCHMIVELEDIDVHGPKFLAECNRVGALIGLEHCEPEEAWNWPAHHLGHEDSESNILDEDDSAYKRVRGKGRRRGLRGAGPVGVASLVVKRPRPVRR